MAPLLHRAAIINFFLSSVPDLAEGAHSLLQPLALIDGGTLFPSPRIPTVLGPFRIGPCLRARPLLLHTTLTTGHVYHFPGRDNIVYVITGK